MTYRVVLVNGDSFMHSGIIVSNVDVCFYASDVFDNDYNDMTIDNVICNVSVKRG